MADESTKFGMRDVSEVVIGSGLLAFPLAVSEEVWNISQELMLGRILLIIFASIALIAWFGYYMFYNSNVSTRRWEFVFRVSCVYAITLAVSAFMLAVIDQFPLSTEPDVAIKRMIIVALPASFSATIVDSLH